MSTTTTYEYDAPVYDFERILTYLRQTYDVRVEETVLDTRRPRTWHDDAVVVVFSWKADDVEHMRVRFSFNFECGSADAGFDCKKDIHIMSIGENTTFYTNMPNSTVDDDFMLLVNELLSPPLSTAPRADVVVMNFVFAAAIAGSAHFSETLQTLRDDFEGNYGSVDFETQ